MMLVRLAKRDSDLHKPTPDRIFGGKNLRYLAENYRLPESRRAKSFISVISTNFYPGGSRKIAGT